MTAETKCHKCGRRLGAFALGGDVCPACLLLEGLSSEPRPASGATAPAAFPGTGRRFADYELLEEIARGGMGVVYRARQVSLNRIVAVKMILSGQLATAAEVQRFRIESAAAAKLQHPNILGIHEVGEHEGRHYFSMEYIEGRNLAELVKGGPLPAGRAAAYLKAIAEAIHCAHQKGVLHRDLKPSNVLVDAFDQPRVTDFGLAKQIQSDSDLTLSGQVLGTPNFMPPEQAGARRRSVGPHSDVYGLGAVLFFLLTGRAPFVADSVEATLHAVLNTEPLSPRQFNPGLPRDLETICLKCLEKEPSRRYISAQALADDLSRFLRDEPIAARPVSRPERAWRWCRRNPAIASLAATVLVLLAVVAVGSSVYALRLRAANERSTAQLREAYLGNARALRWSGRAGRRFESLDLLAKAAAIRPSADLRNEAIASLALVDVRAVREWPWPKGASAVAFDFQHHLYAVADPSGQVTLRRTQDDGEVRSFPPLDGPVGALCFSQNGAVLVAKLDESAEAIRAFAIGKGPQWVRCPGVGRVSAFGLDRTGQHLAVAWATAGKTNVLMVYDTVSGQVLSEFELPQGPSLLEFCPAGIRVAVSGWGDQVEVWDWAQRRRVQVISAPQRVKSLAWHPDGECLAAGTQDTRMYVWEVTTGRLRLSASGHQSDVVLLAFSPTGDWLASTSWDSTLRVWDAALGRELVQVASEAHYLYGFSPDGRQLGHKPTGEQLSILEIVGDQECRSLHLAEDGARNSWGLSFSADSELLASAHPDGTRLWHVPTGRQLGWIKERWGTETAILHPRTGDLITSGWSGVKLWPSRSSDKATGRLHHGPAENLGQPNDCRGLSLDRSGQLLAVARSNQVHLLELPAGRERTRIQFDGMVFRQVLSADAQWCAAWIAKGTTVSVADVRVGKVMLQLDASYASGLAFSPDGKWLATGSQADYRFWNTSSWSLTRTVKRRNAGGIGGLITFSPDSRMAAFTDSPRTIRLIEVLTGGELALLEPPVPVALDDLVFSPDGGLLAAGCQVEGIQLWNLRLIRQQLAAMNLDWDGPALPPAAPALLSTPVSLEVLAAPGPDPSPK